MTTDLVRDWMHTPAITVAETTLLPEARDALTHHKIRRLPVVDENGQLAGIVTQSDIFSISASHVTDVQDYDVYYTNGRVPVKEFMTTQVIAATPALPIVEVAQLMLDHRISGLPVVEEGKVVGMITESDIFRLLISMERDRTTKE